MSSITKEEFRQVRKEIHELNKFTNEIQNDVAFIRLRHKTIKSEHLMARLANIEAANQLIRTRNARIDGLMIDLVEAGENSGNRASEILDAMKEDGNLE